MAVQLEQFHLTDGYEVHDLSGFGGLPLCQLIESTEGFIRSVTYKHKGQLMTASGDEVGALSGQTKIIRLTESMDFADASGTIYPALIFLKNIKYNDALLTVFQRQDFRRDRPQKQAALEILDSTFSGMTSAKASSVLEQWIDMLTYYNDQFTVRTVARGKDLQTAEGYLMFALAQIGVDQVMALPNVFPKSVAQKLKNVDLTKLYPESTYGIGRSMTVLPFVLPVEQRPDPELVNQVSGGHDEVERSLSNITNYAEKKIARSVVAYLKRNNINFESIPRRYLPVLEMYINGKSQREIIAALGLDDTVSLRKLVGRMMYQFSFGRSPGKPEYLRRTQVQTIADEDLIEIISGFCTQALDMKVPFSREDETVLKNYQELAFVKIIARKLLRLPENQRIEVVKGLLLEKAEQSVKVFGVEKSVINTFRRHFDTNFLDGVPLEVIFDGEKATQHDETQRRYINILSDIKALKLQYILPESAAEVVDFMQNYLHLTQRGLEKRAISLSLARDFNYEASYVSILHQKAALLADLVFIVKATPKGIGRNIMEAWTLLDFVDKAKKTI
ncbi:MAG: hypothetical protein COV79_05715 [Parcubacteria group bacterium CG11_big_fil_rev_8_21_14_0_20_41_14]|nr:MAG: hypothetical protein COV79_05715 [Parcubacteria group bacterium CG11_big_fil_rev_8_21_14_0_20_41_14]